MGSARSVRGKAKAEMGNGEMETWELVANGISLAMKLVAIGMLLPVALGLGSNRRKRRKRRGLWAPRRK